MIHLYLNEGKVITDKTYGHATYGCVTCCGYNDSDYGAPYLVQDPTYIGVGDEEGVDVYGIDACTGGAVLIDTYYGSWSSSNPSIMTVSPRSVTGVAAGSAQISTRAAQLPNGDGQDQRSCPVAPVITSGGGTVQTPSQIFVENDVTATVNCSLTSVARTITYLIEDSTGAPMGTTVSIRENVPVTTSSCNGNLVHTGTTCLANNLYAPGTLNSFNDYLWAGCPSSASVEPCGFTFANQQWQYCPASGPPTSVGTVGPVNAGNAIISVRNNTTSLVGTTIGP